MADQSYIGIQYYTDNRKAFFLSPIISDLVNSGRAKGLDVSRYDWENQPGGVLDYEAIKAAGIVFIVIKAMDGTAESKGFRENYAAAMAAGLVVLCYQFIYSFLSANTQANAFAALMKQFPPHLPPVVDFERYGESIPDSGQLGGYMTTFEANYGEYPIIYTSPGYWGSYGSTKPFFALSRLWVAHWGAISPSVPAPWTDWFLWQFSATGDPAQYGYDMTVPGAKKAVDENWFNGTEEELRKLAGLDDGVVDPPIGDPMAKIETFQKTFECISPTYLRREASAAGLDTTVIRPLDIGYQIQASGRVSYDNGDQWLCVGEGFVAEKFQNSLRFEEMQGFPVDTAQKWQATALDGFPAFLLVSPERNANIVRELQVGQSVIGYLNSNSAEVNELWLKCDEGWLFIRTPGQQNQVLLEKYIEPTDPPAEPIWPAYYDLTSDQGVTTRYYKQ